MKPQFKISTGDIDEELIKKTALVYISVIFLGLIAVGFVFPWFGEVTRIRNDYKKIEAKTKELSQGLELLDSIGGTITENDSEMLQKVMPLVFDPGLILSSLRGIAQITGTNVVDYSLAGGSLEEVESKKAGIVRSTRLKVKISGSSEAVMGFMKMVEESVPLASVAEVSVGQVAKIIGEVPGTTTLSLTVDYVSLPVGVSEKMEIGKYIINEKDLATLAVLKGYQKNLSVSAPGSASGGNQNLFGD